MDGFWRVHRTGSREAAGRSPAVRAVLATSTWTCVGWHLGMLDLLRTRDEHTLLAGLGPDVLADAFASSGPTAHGGVDEGVRRLLVAPQRPVCVALLDQRVVAGLGTIWMAESLFAERLWPWTPVGVLDARRVRGLLLTASRLVGASVTVARRAGLGAVERRVHGRHRGPCVRCGTPIALGSTRGQDVRPDQGALERVVYWCPRCQAPGA
ncbi:Fpg/Nei family DNA glycosylase [Xylanimonas allomyrinae]|uniref:Fpg/Nei family DNA glycosylase n=2 Tax=Xylanimonas allomyrinae TaxID=2509459 RepID=A0A4P6EP62_9MICO|nr:Fpg/Nei family DNA glycosylase [Xylanimonas allomyrinae]